MRRAELFASLRAEIPVHRLLRLQRMAEGPLRHRVLRELEANPGADIGTVARTIGRSRSTVSEAVGALGRAQLVHVFDDSDDQRRHLLELSPDGRDYLAHSGASGAAAARKLARLEQEVTGRKAPLHVPWVR